MLKQKSVLNNLAKINDDKGQRISQMETIIRNENLFYSTVNYSSIYKLINLPIFNNEVNNQIVSVIIPPYPCEICLDNQCDIFKSYSNKGVHFNIFTPRYRYKDMIAKFSQTTNVKVYFYNEKTIKSIEAIDQLVLVFHNQYGNNIFLANKIIPELTSDVIESYEIIHK
jgi:hypothetical protein